METIKQTLFTGWYFMRWLRLIFGIFFLVQAIQTHDTLIRVIAGFFLFTSITNTGCCGAGSCATAFKKSINKKPEEITFEEIKSK
jgi:hypothetical protein